MTSYPTVPQSPHGSCTSRQTHRTSPLLPWHCIMRSNSTRQGACSSSRRKLRSSMKTCHSLQTDAKDAPLGVWLHQSSCGKSRGREMPRNGILVSRGKTSFLGAYRSCSGCWEEMIRKRLNLFEAEATLVGILGPSQYPEIFLNEAFPTTGLSFDKDQFC